MALSSYQSLESGGGGTGLLAPPERPVRRRPRRRTPGGGPPPPPDDDGGDGDGWGDGDDPERDEKRSRGSHAAPPRMGWIVAVVSVATVLLLAVMPHVPGGWARGDAEPGVERPGQRGASRASLLLVATSAAACWCAHRERRRGRGTVARHWLLVTILSGMTFVTYVFLAG